MKKITFALLLLSVTAMTSCYKATINPPLASINIVNASPDVPGVTVNFTLSPIRFYQYGVQYGSQSLLNYGSSANYGEPNGTVPLTLISSADTTHHIYQGNLSLGPGKLYSMYIYGNTPTIATLLLTDDIPVHQDSVCGARFINLSPDAGPVNISLQGGNGNEFSSLAYKSISPFKSYSYTTAISSNGSYTWQVSDELGNVLTTFNWEPKIFRNNTLVISGSEAAGTVQVFKVNNY